MSDLFLGLDCSTQSLSAIIIEESKVIYSYSLNFERDLPQYNTKNGIVILGDERIVHSYPLMWVEALDLLLGIMKEAGVKISQIRAISGSGQQHGTVYLNDRFEKKLQNLNPHELIRYQIHDCFTRDTAPIWMDSSTHKQCEEIRESLGGMEETIKITGSNTFERFSGPQIRKFYQENPNAYENTSIIHLVSSFMASILSGKNAPIDHGDGAGMNLMNISTKEWDENALNATAPRLKDKLPKLCNSYDIIGKISPYFVTKFGFFKDCIVVAWSGDNPNSLIGTGLIEQGKVALSLGTSDTYFGYIKSLALDFNGEGHVFGAPTGDYMSLICYKNGSLARENIKNLYNLDWNGFSEILRETPPGNHGKIMLPYYLPEIVPLVLQPKIYRFGFDEKDIEGNVRAIIESQFLSMRLHSQWIGEKPTEIIATGGASTNKDILQVAADIFNTRIKTLELTDSAALGAAFRAVKSFYDTIKKNQSWKDIINRFQKHDEKNLLSPNENLKELYEDMMYLYQKYEEFVLRNGKDPEPLRKKFIKKYFNG